MPSAPLARASVELTLGNDISSGNEFRDDHYTGTVALRFGLAGFRVRLEERMFTDTVAETRFDETLAGVRLGLPRTGAWYSGVEFGVVHLGRGLLGARLQNGIHKLVNNDPVHLSYPAGSELHPYVVFDVRRHTSVTKSLSVSPGLEGFTAPGFRSSLEGSVRLSWDATRALALHGAGGYRMDRVDYAPLQPWVLGSGVTLALGTTLFNRIDLSWTQNQYGLQERHWNVVVRFPLP